MSDSKKGSSKKSKTIVVEPSIVEEKPTKELPDGDGVIIDQEEAIEIEAAEENLHEDSLLPVLDLGHDLTLFDPKQGKDPLTLYIREISRYPLLSIEQEKALTQALKETGDIEIAKKLVLHNLRLVVKIAMEYKTAWQNTMDLIQEGNVGLMKAVSKYDRSKGAKLSYYASWWIKSYILKFLLDNFRMVKVGTTNEQKKLFYNLMREKERLESQGIKPDAKMISENLGVSEKAVVTMEQRLSPGSGDVSLDTPMDAGSSGGSLFGDMLEDEAMGPEEIVSDLQSMEILQEHLAEFVGGLKERDREIFKKRLLSEVPESLQSIADGYGVSRERIRQIESRLLKNLKVYMAEHIR